MRSSAHRRNAGRIVCDRARHGDRVKICRYRQRLASRPSSSARRCRCRVSASLLARLHRDEVVMNVDARHPSTELRQAGSQEARCRCRSPGYDCRSDPSESQRLQHTRPSTVGVIIHFAVSRAGSRYRRTPATGNAGTKCSRGTCCEDIEHILVEHVPGADLLFDHLLPGEVDVHLPGCFRIRIFCNSRCLRTDRRIMVNRGGPPKSVGYAY